ncbi:MAG TPA: ABC transporter permease, partial [Candidatus Paceibacterota bacterium]|nr:ABC transporter permease [Candidatus Paceibacterota bacterium]
MLISDLFSETTSAILSNKLRSSLTILGIVIGIGSVIGMISIGSGSKANVESQLQSMGTNMIYVMPGMQMNFSPISQGRGTAQSLTIDDVKAIGEIPYVSDVSPIATRRFQVISKSSNTNTQ